MNEFEQKDYEGARNSADQVKTTAENIMSIFGMEPKDHIRKREKFNPDRSINNTQLFRKDEYKEEAAVIESELKEYVYSFPYLNEADMKQSF